ncbi:MAG: Lrp/AsnC ligand binding domain-containing protein [Methanothrix sp.]|nr:Lrp/AsnC ligand binding domain-containing protein [Methanothrix sp.]MCX8207622.1 Lrp/AsnC ligand binding domain-containing protein [Methanothrix sp.]
MVSAIVLIKAVPCQENIAYNSIKAIEGVEKLYTLFGDHDFLAIIDTADQALLKRVLKEIEMLNSVISVDALLSRKSLCPENREALDFSALHKDQNHINSINEMTF